METSEIKLWDGMRDLQVGDVFRTFRDPDSGDVAYERVTAIEGDKVLSEILDSKGCFLDILQLPDGTRCFWRLSNIDPFRGSPLKDLNYRCSKCTAKLKGLNLLCSDCSTRYKTVIGTPKWSFRVMTEHKLHGTQNCSYVYLMKSSEGLYKIGRTKNLQTRRKQLSSKDNPVTVICAIRRDDCYLSLEQDLHWLFSSKRSHGEWFRLEDEDVDYFRYLAGENI